MMKNLSEIKVTKRQTYGYQGAPGEAYTITAKCPDGKRRTCQYSYEAAPKGKVRLYAKSGQVVKCGPAMVEKAWSEDVDASILNDA